MTENEREIGMIASERRRYILRELNVKGILGLKETAKALGASEITVRRDFEKLEKEGKLKRVQGGVALEGAEDGAELTMSKKMPLDIHEKERIAEYAAQLAEDGSCVFIDGGTTMVPLVSLLSKRRLTIVTYNTLVLKRLVNPAAEIIIIGGKYLSYYNMNVGSIAQDMLKLFSFDVAFLGCSGINLKQNTVYMAETESLHMKRIALEASTKSFLLADSSKFQKRGFYKLCDFSKFESIICNSFEANEAMPENLIMV